MKYIDGFRDGDAARFLSREIKKTGKALETAGKTIRIMEVCGSHTMAISRYGIRDVLPDNIQLLSGPGCPVCVTDTGYVDAAISLAEKGVIVATFGDMVRVPGTTTTLGSARSNGGDIRVCYSPLDAIQIAKENPSRAVVFLGIGFETTMAPVTALVRIANEQQIENLSVLTAFKLVPPALSALIDDPEVQVNAFLCPAHVSAIIGSDVYLPYVEEHGVPCVVCGFEPLDILYGIENAAKQLATGNFELVNQYSRVVRPEGNIAAQKLFETYLKPIDASWRGIGVIEDSGLGLKPKFDKFNAEIVHGIDVVPGLPDKNCLCGEVLKGKIIPSECPMFDTACTPAHPVGPCMVSSEGSCAAHYKYAR